MTGRGSKQCEPTYKLITIDGDDRFVKYSACGFAIPAYMGMWGYMYCPHCKTKVVR